jgi:uncharacterized protein
MVLGIIGGTFIGLAAVWLYLSLGRIAGISGIATSALLRSKDSLWPLMFVVGLGVGGWLAYWFLGGRPAMALTGEQSAWLVLGGLLAGFGTRLGSGCTSGHGVCGMARLSKRSLAATLTFLVVGMATATGLAAL